MKQEDKLRNTLREYYDNQYEPFEESDWEHASAYLHTVRRKRKARRLAFIIIPVFSALFISLFYFTKSAANDTAKGLSLSAQRSEPVPAPPPVITGAPILPTLKTAAGFNSNRKTEQTLLTINSKPENVGTLRVLPRGLPPVKVPQISEPATTAGPEWKSFVQNDTAGKVMLAGNNPVATTANPAGGTVSDNDERAAPENLKEEPNIVSTSAKTPAQNQDSSINVSLPAETQLSLSDNKPQSSLADSIKINRQEENISAKTANNSAPVLRTDTPVTMQDVAADTLPDLLIHTRQAGKGIFYEAGAAWFYGWKGPEKRDARCFSPIPGINYMSRLTTRYSLSFGLQYFQLSHLSNSSKTSRVSTYVYGEQSRVTVITPSAAHYLAMPLRVHYYAGGRNSFGAGLNLAYLLNVDAMVTSYDERPGLSENYKTVKLSGYTEGFSWFDSQLAFFYRRSIGRSFGLQAEVFMGLTDIKQDRFFGFSHKELNSGAKLSFVYFAFRKNRK